nr:transcriptional regulator [Microbispora sp. CL1-1]
MYAAHSVGDIWVQTHADACAKGNPGWEGRAACARHVATLTLTKTASLALVVIAAGLTLHLLPLLAGLAMDAASHYWADRRVTLQRLADRLGKAEFYRLGAGHLGSGAHALDQSWHVGWLFITALIITL